MRKCALLWGGPYSIVLQSAASQFRGRAVVATANQIMTYRHTSSVFSKSRISSSMVVCCALSSIPECNFKKSAGDERNKVTANRLRLVRIHHHGHNVHYRRRHSLVGLQLPFLLLAINHPRQELRHSAEEAPLCVITAWVKLRFGFSECRAIAFHSSDSR